MIYEANDFKNICLCIYVSNVKQPLHLAMVLGNHNNLQTLTSLNFHRSLMQTIIVCGSSHTQTLNFWPPLSRHLFCKQFFFLQKVYSWSVGLTVFGFFKIEHFFGSTTESIKRSINNGTELLLFVGESFTDLLWICSLVQQFADQYSMKDKISSI